MANYRMNKLQIGSNTYECAEWYGVCSTAANTQNKIVTIDGFNSGQLVAGCIVVVRFNNAQNYNGVPRLNINGTGDKNIYRDGGSAFAGQYEWPALSLIVFVYDGSGWQIASKHRATTTYWGETKLTDTISNDSTTALTPKAVYDAGFLTLADLPVWDGSVT